MNLDPWAWSLENVLLLLGVIVAGLGAIATVIVASLALAQTRRANRLEFESRDRSARAGLRKVVDEYVEKWMPSGSGTHEEARELELAFAAATSEYGSDGISIFDWVRMALSSADFDAIKYQEAHQNDLAGPPDREQLLVAARYQVRVRVMNWAVGETFGWTPLKSTWTVT